jgi:hypothetical protein
MQMRWCCTLHVSMIVSPLPNAVGMNAHVPTLTSARVPMSRMAGLKGEAGGSPALSRNCNACGPTSEARSPAPVDLLAPRGLGVSADGSTVLAADVITLGYPHTH